MNWCILIPLLTGLLSALLGYLLGRQRCNNNTSVTDDRDLKLRISELEKELETYKNDNSSLNTDVSLVGNSKEEYDWKLKFKNSEEELSAYKKNNERLKIDLESCKESHSKVEAQLKAAEANNLGKDMALDKKILSLEAELEKAKRTNESLQASLDIARNVSLLASKGSVAKEIYFNADAAKAVYGKKIKQDDLTLVEGIGPKIQELFHDHGVKTWKALSECSIEKCQKVLDSGGEGYRIHNPSTWPEQARLAYEGLWQKLSDWQDKLDGGREVE